MQSMKPLREEIDKINHELLVLLNKRARFAQQIGEIKKINGISTLNETREKEIVERMILANDGPLTDYDVVFLFETIMKVCRELQEADY